MNVKAHAQHIRSLKSPRSSSLLRLLLIPLWLLVLNGCSGSGSSETFSAAPSSQAPEVATIRVNQVLLRALPQEVTRQRFTGFDSQGQVRFGPVTRNKAALIELDGVSTAVTRLQVEYLQGDIVVGLGSVAVDLTPGQTLEVDNPPFQDVREALTSLQVTPGGATIADGSGQQFTVVGTFADNTQADLTSSATWTSTDPTVATVAPGGLASAVDPGQTTVTASIGPVTDSTTLTVSTATITSITVTPANPVVAAGVTQGFTATATLSDGTLQNVTDLAVWSSGNTAAATIDPAKGVATAVAPGQSTVTASVGSVSGSTTLTVSDATVTSLVLSPGNVTLPDGSSQQFHLTANFTSGPSLDVTSAAVWNSSDDTVARVSGGLATAVDPGGPVTIQASFGGTSTDTGLTVTAAEIASIEVTPATPAIADGTNQEFTATATLTDGTPLDVTTTASWTSGTSATATIDSSTGVATAVNTGQTVITAAVGAVSGSTTLTVTSATVTGITVTPADPILPNGAQQQFSAVATFSNGTTQDVTSSAQWTSDTTGVATITSPGGLASAVASSGNSGISATFGGQTGSTTLTTSAATVESITITPNPAVLADGDTQQFSASAHYSDGSDLIVTGSAVWASNNFGVATISSGSGLAAAQGVGNTQVTATFDGVSGTAEIVVSEATLKSLAIDPPQALSAPGTKRRYRAVGTYSDGSTQDLTSQVTWSSDSAGVTLANDNLGPNRFGQAAIKLGTPYTGTGTPATVTATLGSTSATSTLYLGAFAYVGNADDDSVSVYIIDPTTGALTEGTPAATGDTPYSVAVDPSGRFVYVANLRAASISIYTIDPITGNLTEVGTPFVAGPSPVAVTVEPTGRFAYVADSLTSDIHVCAIDPDTGSLTEVGTPAVVESSPQKVTVDPTGRFLYSSNSIGIYPYTIDSATGALTAGIGVRAGTFPFGLTVEPSGQFAYVPNSNSDDISVFTISDSTGDLTTVGSPIATGDGPTSIAVDPSGRYAYVSIAVSGSVYSYAIDPSTGVLTEVGTPGPAGSYPYDIAMDSTGRFAYTANLRSDDVSVFTVDSATGALTAGTTVAAGASPFRIVTTP